MQDDPELLVRSIARAVIRRVAAEYPCSPASELRLRMSAANPFEDCDPSSSRSLSRKSSGRCEHTALPYTEFERTYRKLIPGAPQNIPAISEEMPVRCEHFESNRVVEATPH